MSKTQHTDLFKAIADENRRVILTTLLSGEQSVQSLTDVLSVSQPAVSQHIKVLQTAGLIRCRKDGRQRFYALVPHSLSELSDWLETFELFWEDRLDALETHLKTTTQ
jgi:DNA-binding transcriptional ArsR family regulator